MIYSKTEYVWSDRQNRYILLRRSSIFWTGEVASCKGASGQQRTEADQSQAFTSTLMNDYEQSFSGMNNIISGLKSSLQPIINQGIGQYGFTNAEDAAMRTQATAGTSGAYQAAKTASQEAQAAQGGGNQFIGSGVQAANQARLAQAAAQQESGQQLGITEQGYAQGRQNYMNAMGQMGSLAGLYNPSSYANAANTAGAQAFNQASKIQELDAAAPSFGKMLLGSGGGIMGAGLGNLDTTGGSTGLEQLGNFALGAIGG